MVLLIFGLSILLLILLFEKSMKSGVDDPYIEGVIVAFIVVLTSIIAAIGLTINVQRAGLIDEKLELAQTQNAEIETKVKVAVEDYIGHESETYKSLKPEEVMAAATVYPELQSNQLVQNELNLYEENNKKIAELKEQKINAKIARWWLYFGN